MVTAQVTMHHGQSTFSTVMRLRDQEDHEHERADARPRLKSIQYQRGEPGAGEDADADGDRRAVQPARPISGFGKPKQRALQELRFLAQPTSRLKLQRQLRVGVGEHGGTCRGSAGMRPRSRWLRRRSGRWRERVGRRSARSRRTQSDYGIATRVARPGRQTRYACGSCDNHCEVVPAARREDAKEGLRACNRPARAGRGGRQKTSRRCDPSHEPAAHPKDLRSGAQAPAPHGEYPEGGEPRTGRGVHQRWWKTKTTTTRRSTERKRTGGTKKRKRLFGSRKSGEEGVRPHAAAPLPRRPRSAGARRRRAGWPQSRPQPGPSRRIRPQTASPSGRADRRPQRARAGRRGRRASRRHAAEAGEPAAAAPRPLVPGLPPTTLLFQAPRHRAAARRSRRTRTTTDQSGDGPPPLASPRRRGEPQRSRTTRRNTVVKVRAPREPELITEPQKVKGSTRLEAKKQRRRDGRDAGRRRPVITEAEFLARRESVDRQMIVRDEERPHPDRRARRQGARRALRRQVAGGVAHRQRLPRPRAERAAQHGGRVRRHRPRPQRGALLRRGRLGRRARPATSRAASSWR